jgi:hypothetical protein
MRLARRMQDITVEHDTRKDEAWYDHANLSAN